jgi:hypothetical protein
MCKRFGANVRRWATALLVTGMGVAVHTAEAGPMPPPVPPPQTGSPVYTQNPNLTERMGSDSINAS